MRKYNNKSQVEKIFLEKSGYSFCSSPEEKINVIQVQDFAILGKLTSLRFIEWLQSNPEGLICLPTGKTPESFIKHTSNFLNNWKQKRVQTELEKYHVDPGKKPKMTTYNFVQMDEYFPIQPTNPKSFLYFVKNFYLKGFGFDSKKAILIDITKIKQLKNKDLNVIFPNQKVDLTLRFRTPKNNLEQKQKDIIEIIDQFTNDYENEIHKLGGFGFVLGGIGPDGHIAFNIKGSSHFSPTRLLNINYQTAAAAARTFGGIEFARDKAAITIGLNSFVQNPTTTTIIIASGFGKAKVVKDAIENKPSIKYPATVLQKLKSSCFYITQDSASLLLSRKHHDLKKLKKIPIQSCQQVLIDISTKTNKTLSSINIKKDYLGSLLNNKKLNIENLIEKTKKDLLSKIKNGLQNFKGKSFLHTSPHPDDIMLGYFPFIAQLAKNNKHHFAIMTSGSNAVSDRFLSDKVKKTKDFDEIKILKGKVREEEEKKLWGLLGFNKKDISFLNLGFYSASKKEQEIIWQRDAKPIYNLLQKIKPDIITVAVDPKDIGPSSHYKVLQAIKMALEKYSKENKNFKIWGYRNVWSQFKPSDANIFVPVDSNSLLKFRDAFINSYKSQVKAEYPSTEYDGPFCDFAQKILIKQHETLKTCLGKQFFSNNSDKRLKNSKAFCFLKEMSGLENLI